MCLIAVYVNRQVRHRRGHPPPPHTVQRAFLAAALLRERLFGITTLTAAAIACAVSRPSVAAALAILQAEDAELADRVLRGAAPLIQSGAQVRRRAQLVETFKFATAADRIALGRVVGVGTVFDTVVAPAL